GVAAIRLGHGAGADQARVGTALRLGQTHGAGPLAADQSRQILLLLLGRAVRDQRIDRTVGQARVHAQRQIGRAGHLLDHHVEYVGQTLAADFGRAGQRRPAAFGELAISRAETLWALHAVALRVVLATLA